MKQMQGPLTWIELNRGRGFKLLSILILWKPRAVAFSENLFSLPDHAKLCRADSSMLVGHGRDW